MDDQSKRAARARAIAASNGGEISESAAQVVVDAAAASDWPRNPAPVNAHEHAPTLARLGLILRQRGEYTLTTKGMSMGML